MKSISGSDQRNGLEVAIIGMVGRFPGAPDLQTFWHNLCQGKESITVLMDEALIAAGVDERLLKDSRYVKVAAGLNAIDQFDATFFDISPREAELTDPQHRIFLECAWEALETAGYDASRYRGLIGVYGGAGFNRYVMDLATGDRPSSDLFQIMVSNDKDFLTTRVSYKLNLRGPSCTVQTACSTSLVAVHLACRGLLSGECDMALAGGVSTVAQSGTGYLYQDGDILSPDGHCRAFDAQAQGTVSGSGVGIVVLKRLEDALADGDCIQAVIKGSAINNDGNTKVSYTAPSIAGQTEVIRAAQLMAEVPPDSIHYLEAHGTGTALGDPIEVAALTQAFRMETAKQQFCALGSVKTNIGHLDAAAGVTGLIKTALALRHRQIPPSLNFQQPNPQIDFDSSPFYVNTELTEWPTNGAPRRAGVSSFGIGGTNAHVIVEEAPAIAPSSPARPWQLLLLSAKTASALDTTTTNLANHLQQHPSLNLADVAYTLQVGRQGWNHRRMVLCQTFEDAVPALVNQTPERVLSHSVEPGYHPVVFLFPGQGAQYVNMGRDLYETETVFRQQVDQCCELLQPHLGVDLRDILYPPTVTEAIAHQLHQTAIAQPALFVVEYALAQLWMAWGIRPEAMIGHSIGEYVAACVAGIFSLEDALALVAARGALMQNCLPGAMLSVHLSAADLQPWLGEGVTLAADNGPTLCSVSGSASAIANLSDRLAAKGVQCRRLQTSHAFHSPMMAEIIEPFVAKVQQVDLHPPQIPLFSNVTGTWMTAAQAVDPTYWAKHLREPVQFASGIAELVQDPARLFLEVGPGWVLSTLVQQQTQDHWVVTSMRHPQVNQSDVSVLLNAVGRLWLAGVSIDWQKFYASEHRHRLPLPTYPFERQRYWIESQRQTSPSLTRKADLSDWFYVPSWTRSPLTRSTGIGESKTWLIFADPSGVGRSMGNQLQAQNHVVVTVIPGEQFSRIDDWTYTLNPAQSNDYLELIQGLKHRDHLPQHIVHAWSLTGDRSFSTGSLAQTFEQHQEMGFSSLLYLTQALGQESVRLWVLTNQVQAVTGEETLCPHKSTILGLCRVIPQEFPQLRCAAIDVVVPEPESFQHKALVDQLITEFTVSLADPIIAYRGTYRWVQTFTPLRSPQSTQAVIALKPQGVYLVVGNLTDGLGLVFAESLAKTLKARVALVGQTSLPERAAWDAQLATTNTDSTSLYLQRFQTLEDAGAQFQVLKIDVTEPTQLEAAIAQIEDQWGTLNGVLFATPMSSIDSAIAVEQLDAETCDRQFQTKVHGLSALAQVLRDRTLDFCLVQSSLASIVGGLGLGAYAAANCFVDALVQQQLTHRTPWISINWDAYHNDPQSEAQTDLAMSAQEVWQVTQRILTEGWMGQIVVTPGDLKIRLQKSRATEVSQTTSQLSPESSSTHHARPHLQQSYVAPRTDLERAIAAIWQDLLGIGQVGIHDNFFELGGHSLLAVQVTARLREKFQVELPLKSILFDAPTIAQLADIITAQQPPLDTLQEMAALLDEIQQLSPDDIDRALAEELHADA